MSICKHIFLILCLILIPGLSGISQEKENQSSNTTEQAEKQSSESSEQESAEQEKKETEEKPNEVKVTQRTPSEKLLPVDTRLWLSIPQPTDLVGDFHETPFGEIIGDQSLQPFVEKSESELKKMLASKNIDLGLKPEDLFDVQSGEVCIAAVLNAEAESEFGFVMLADVKETEDEANDMLARLAKEFKAQKGTSELIKSGSVNVTKWSFEAKGVAPKRFALHAIVDGWLFVCDNESLARQMVKQIEAKESLSSLADNEVFKKVRDKSKIPNAKKPTQINFFIEPFGYFDIVKKVAERHPSLQRERQNDYAGIIREQGFDAIIGFGGNILLDGKEIVYRSHLLAPSNGSDGRRYKGSAEMLDFQNDRKHDLSPEGFVSETSSGYMTITWNLQKAFSNAQPVVDAAAGEGTFKNLVDSIKTDPDGPLVDLKVLVDKLDNRITVFTDNTEPIDESSEKVVVAVKVKEDIKTVYEWVKRIINIPKENVVKFEGIDLYVDKNEEDPFEDGGFDIEDDFGDETGEEDEVAPPKPIFDERIYAMMDGYILMSNNLDYMKKLITNAKKKEKPGDRLKAAGDYKAVNDFLANITDEKKICYRQFIRLDESIRVNYEMLRQGKMGSSNTVMAKLLNQILSQPGGNDDEPRIQKLDGSDLPEDFKGRIAPYFGPAGFVLENEKDGWTMTGVLLPKKNRAKVANNKDGTKQRN